MKNRWFFSALQAWIVLIGWLSSAFSNAQEPLPSLRIDQAQVWLITPERAERSFWQLPFDWDAAQGRIAGQADFELAFEWSGDLATPHAVFFPMLGNRYEVWLNGVMLSRGGRLLDMNTAIKSEAAWAYSAKENSRFNYSKAPRLFSIPPSLLQKNNLFRVRLEADAGRAAGLAPFWMGAEREVRAMYERAWWQSVGLAMVVLTVMLLTVGACGLLWSLRLYSAQGLATQYRREPIYALGALAALCCALRQIDHGIEYLPWAWEAWRMLMFCATAVMLLALLGILFYTLKRRFQQRFLILGFISFTLILIAACAISMGENDLFSIKNWFFGVKTEVLSIQIAALLCAVGIFAFTLKRFHAASAQARDLMQSLQSRIAEREAELKMSYEKLESLAREQERSLERSKILRNMHDGVGAHLSAAIRQVEHSPALSQNAEVLVTLRDGLDQLKLSIDAMHWQAGDVSMLLANLRYRMQKRFEASGIEWVWQVNELPIVERLDHAAMQQLQFILFEALSNVLQHSSANKIILSAHATSQILDIEVQDNGCGFDVQSAQSKHSRGLENMRQRASSIGVALTILSIPSQTRIKICIPIVPAQNPSTHCAETSA